MARQRYGLKTSKKALAILEPVAGLSGIPTTVAVRQHHPVGGL